MSKQLLNSNKVLKPVIPKFTLIENKQYVSFRDIFENLIINQILQTDYQLVNKKVNVVKEHANTLSPRHRKRLLKQLRKGVRKINSNTPTGDQTTRLL